MAYSELYWQKEEVMPKKELRELQLKRLRWVVRHAYENVAHYRQKLKAVEFILTI